MEIIENAMRSGMFLKLFYEDNGGSKAKEVS